MAAADEQEEVGVLRGEHHDHDVGEAGDGQRDEGRVDDGDEEDADEAEREQQVKERVGMMRGRGRGGGERREDGAERCDRGCGQRASWRIRRAGRCGSRGTFGLLAMSSRKRRVGKWGQDVGFGGVAAEEFDGGDAVGRERVVDVAGEVVADGGGRDGDARRPLFDERVDVGEAVVAGVLQVVDELGGGDGR